MFVRFQHIPRHGLLSQPLSAPRMRITRAEVRYEYDVDILLSVIFSFFFRFARSISKVSRVCSRQTSHTFGFIPLFYEHVFCKACVRSSFKINLSLHWRFRCISYLWNINFIYVYIHICVCVCNFDAILYLIKILFSQERELFIQLIILIVVF